MAKKHPVADDPLLQDKVDELTKNPELYHLRYECQKAEDILESHQRTIRALEKEIERTKATINALNMAMKTLEKKK